LDGSSIPLPSREVVTKKQTHVNRVIRVLTIIF
jgi:hypothetical protein